MLRRMKVPRLPDGGRAARSRPERAVHGNLEPGEWVEVWKRSHWKRSQVSLRTPEVVAGIV
ncbi:hypothetical protein GCM10010222_17950 [Streptomyces tanashiensis]|nr:hypothetical protein GCM10010222_17950 [Streptomyces tanashiensis]